MRSSMWFLGLRIWWISCYTLTLRTYIGCSKYWGSKCEGLLCSKCVFFFDFFFGSKYLSVAIYIYMLKSHCIKNRSSRIYHFISWWPAIFPISPFPPPRYLFWSFECHANPVWGNNNWWSLESFSQQRKFQPKQHDTFWRLFAKHRISSTINAGEWRETLLQRAKSTGIPCLRCFDESIYAFSFFARWLVPRDRFIARLTHPGAVSAFRWYDSACRGSMRKPSKHHWGPCSTLAGVQEWNRIGNWVKGFSCRCML